MRIGGALIATIAAACGAPARSPGSPPRTAASAFDARAVSFRVAFPDGKRVTDAIRWTLTVTCAAQAPRKVIDDELVVGGEWSWSWPTECGDHVAILHGEIRPNWLGRPEGAPGCAAQPFEAEVRANERVDVRLRCSEP